LLENRNIEYHYIVESNYKIIYSIDDENQFIKIADVFDTRQNPEKNRTRKIKSLLKITLKGIFL
jgi:mRNA-degrading endonuclease RelE of RelBE toxin-antitoxin system